MTNKVIKSVSFNKTSEKDNEILKHIKRRNFSGYVKKLIHEDINGKEGNKEPIQQPVKEEPKPEIEQPKQSDPVEEQPKPISTAERLERAKKKTQKKPASNTGPRLFNQQ